MDNRSLSSALRSLGRRHGPSKRLIASSRRQFSSTPACGVRAIFAETDNGELNAILGTIQERIILPSYLPEKQRKMVFNPKMRSHLEQNPVVIEVEGLEHKFSSIDRFKGIENSKAILNRALAEMRTAEDWSNLGTLLAGYKKAGIKLKADHWGKIVRVAGTRGHIYAVIECAKQADQTGLVLTNRETVVRMLAFVNDKITESKWHATETKQALKWVELVLDLLQRPEHALPTPTPTRDRLHFSRLVRGITLFTRSSAVKVKQRAGEAVDEDLALLRDEVKLFRSLWRDAAARDLTQVEEFAELNPTVERNSAPNGARVPQALGGSAYVQVLAQGIKGIALARELLGDEAEDLAPVEDALDKHLAEFVRTSHGRSKGWEDEFEKVAGRRPDWPSA
ncbi:Uncharacterized protein TCAP_04761 [Tolypocladium capitatum]|uniref:Uncharacterized protein n=1 Tax=Tolypocladium capitatum TaxID=45235 RepID=A0A2K3QCP0_9HYPO|nr:Uncharacterized protein TCAP_04761 [Tolypocladium capitatum]